MTRAEQQANEIAQLRKELTDLKASLAPAPDDRAAVGAWRDQMRAASEARASVMPPSVVRDLAVLPDDVVRGVVHDNRAPTGRPGVIPSQQLSDARPGGGTPVNTSGWVNPAPLGPMPGIGYVDRLLELDSAKQQGARMVEEARRKAAEKTSD